MLIQKQAVLSLCMMKITHWEMLSDTSYQKSLFFLPFEYFPNLSNCYIFFSPDVEFCGYSIPHPSENKINFRIQTRGQ